MKVCYVWNKRVIGTMFNSNVVPRIGDKVKVNGFVFEVKDVIWNLENMNGTYVEVLL